MNRLLAVNRDLVSMAKADIAGLLDGIDFSRPEMVRDALLELIPALVQEYGTIAATAAAEWYEDLRRRAGVPGPHRTVLSPGAQAEQVEATVRYAAGALFGSAPSTAGGILNGAVQRLISYSSRDTIRRNVASDRSRARYARVPSGAKTCAFCEMAAGQGFSYASEEAAAQEFHDDCDCQVAVEWESAPADIAGYDPDEMHERYEAARAEARSGNAEDILAAMRRLYPDRYTDGVKPKD